MDETARHNDKKKRIDPDARIVFSDSPGFAARRLVGANRRIFIDWVVPDRAEDGVISVPSVCWFSPAHNLLLDFGGFNLHFDFMDYGTAWKTYTWYGPGMLPVSSIDLNGPGGQTLNIHAYGMMKPEEDHWTLAVRVENFSGQVLPPARIGLEGVCYVGKEKGSILDLINPVAGAANLLRGDVAIDCQDRSVMMSNPAANVFASLGANLPFLEVSFRKRGTLAEEKLPLHQKSAKREPLRQAIDFRVGFDLPLDRGQITWAAFEWRFGNTPASVLIPVSVPGHKICAEHKAAWTERFVYAETIATPYPLLSEALRRSIAYTRACFIHLGKDKTHAIAQHGDFPIDCSRDTYAMTSLMQYLEPEIAGQHMQSYFLHLIPEQGLGCSYVGAGKRATASHRLLDLACYPFLGLWRYWQVVGRSRITAEKMSRGIQHAIDELFNFAANAVNGLVPSTHRSSDEPCVFPIFVPGNMLLVVTLEKMADLLTELFQDSRRARHCREWSQTLRSALQKQAVIRDSEFGEMWAFEIDGQGKYLLYDQADYPNLLTLPYFGFCKRDDAVYQNTHKFIFSSRNAGYAHTAGSRYATLCDGSKQDPEMPWALGILGELMAAPTPEQARRTYDWVENALSSGLMLSEIVEKHTGRANGPAFGWATALMATLFIEIICGFKPGEQNVRPCPPAGWRRFCSPTVIIQGHPVTLKWDDGRAALTVDGKTADALCIKINA